MFVLFYNGNFVFYCRFFCQYFFFGQLPYHTKSKVRLINNLLACCFIGQYPINIYFPSFFDFIARNSITLNRSPKFITHNFLESVFFQKPVLISWSCLTKDRVHFSQFHFLMDFTPDIILSKFLFIDELINIVLKSHHKLGVH